jgi:HlyD family secretion protein
MTAPCGGIVVYGDEEGHSSGRDIAVGQSVGMWHVLFTVLDMSALLVKIRVNETDISNLKTGMPAQITFDAAGLRGLKGKVSKVPEVTSRDDWRTDPNLKEFEVEVDVEGVHAGVKPGISAVVFVKSARLDGVLRVPVHALRGENLDLFAYVLRQDGEKPSLVKSPVQVGLRGRRFAEIRSGLGAGDPVFLGEPPAELLRVEEEAVAAEGKKKEGGGDEAADGGGLSGPGSGTPAPDMAEEEDEED